MSLCVTAQAKQCFRQVKPVEHPVGELRGAAFQKRQVALVLPAEVTLVTEVIDLQRRQPDLLDEFRTIVKITSLEDEPEVSRVA